MTNASFELLEFKADEERRGLFAAIVSVFGNVDRNGDRVMKGAFSRTLKEWMSRGKPIPVVWSHDHMQPDSFIGSIDPADVKETDQGLVVAGRLDVETNPKAAQIWQLLKDGRIDQWSFAYDAVGKRMSKEKGARRDLLDLDLFEVGPTLVGANGDTRTLSVMSATGVVDRQPAPDPEPVSPPPVPVPEPQPVGASADPVEVEWARQLEDFEQQVDGLVEAKIGRVLSTKTERRVREAIAQLEEILAQLGQEENDDEPKASDDVETKVEEEVPTTTVSADKARLQDAEEFLIQRGRLQLTAAEVFLSERTG